MAIPFLKWSVQEKKAIRETPQPFFFALFLYSKQLNFYGRGESWLLEAFYANHWDPDSHEIKEWEEINSLRAYARGPNARIKVVSTDEWKLDLLPIFSLLFYTYIYIIVSFFFSNRPILDFFFLKRGKIA